MKICRQLNIHLLWGTNRTPGSYESAHPGGHSRDLEEEGLQPPHPLLPWLILPYTRLVSCSLNHSSTAWNIHTILIHILPHFYTCHGGFIMSISGTVDYNIFWHHSVRTHYTHSQTHTWMQTEIRVYWCLQVYPGEGEDRQAMAPLRKDWGKIEMRKGGTIEWSWTRDAVIEL